MSPPNNPSPSPEQITWEPPSSGAPADGGVNWDKPTTSAPAIKWNPVTQVKKPAPAIHAPTQNEPSLVHGIAGAIGDVGSDIASVAERTAKAGLSEDVSNLKEGLRITSRLTQGIIKLPEDFVDHLLSVDDNLNQQLDALHMLVKTGHPVPPELVKQIRMGIEFHHALYYVSDKLHEWTDQALPPPQTKFGRVAEGVATFFAGLMVPLPKGADPALIADQAPGSILFNAEDEAERNLAVLRSAGYRLVPGDLSAYVTKAKTIIGKLFQTVGASRGYGISNFNLDKATSDINVMFGRDPDMLLGDDDLDAIRNQAGAAYDAVRALKPMSPDDQMSEEVRTLGENILHMKARGFKTPFDPQDYHMVESMRSDLNHSEYTGKDIDLLLKGFRRGASDYLRRGATNKDKLVGAAFKEGERIIEQFLAREAERQGSPGLATNLRAARATIAKTWDVQGAMVGGRISPRRLLALRRLRRGQALDPTLDMIARGYEYSPRSFQDVTKLGQAEGRNYLFSWAAWGLLRGDPRLMAVYLAEHGMRKMSESEIFQLSPQEIAAATENAMQEGVRAGTRLGAHSMDELTQRRRRQALREILGLQAEEGSSSNSNANQQ